MFAGHPINTQRIGRSLDRLIKISRGVKRLPAIHRSRLVLGAATTLWGITANKMKLGKFEVHPTADRFPIMSREQLAALTEDIKKNGGLIEPIVLTADGKTLVDGRNRYTACEKADVKPEFRKLSAAMFEAQIIDFISSKNMERRDLDPGAPNIYQWPRGLGQTETTQARHSSFLSSLELSYTEKRIDRRYRRRREPGRFVRMHF